MAECILCKEKIEISFLEKTQGTIIKIKQEGKNQNFYICKTCQKKHKSKLKEEVKKLVSIV